jgi:hypothetical protein
MGYAGLQLNESKIHTDFRYIEFSKDGIMNESRIYQHTTVTKVFIVGLFLLMFGGICLALLFGLQEIWLTIPFIFLMAILFAFVVFAYTSKTIVSEEEITTSTLLGSKTLRWTEVARVSGRGYGIKLHNFDDDVTVAPMYRLPGYEEVIEWIGRKRPDLFGAQEFSEMKRGYLQLFGSLIAIVAVFGMAGAFLLATDPEALTSTDTIVPLIFLVVIIFSVAGSLFFTPQSIAIEGGMLRLRYLLNEKTMLANEIVSVHYTYTQTRNGKRYFIAVNRADRKTIRISGLSIGLPIAYLVLKNWHARNT